MTGLTRHPMGHFLIVLLCILLLFLNLPSGSKKDNLEGLFYWAKKYYLQGMYRESAQKLETLLRFIEDRSHPLYPKIHLLLGATSEKIGKIEPAREYYRLAKSGAGIPEIEEIDFTDLIEYQRIFLGKKDATAVKIIAKESLKPKKKKTPILLVITGLLAVAAGVVYFLLKGGKKSDDVDDPFELVPDYDTRELGITWIRIPAGHFYMGDNFNEGDPDEQPVHRVELDEYFISKYEITFQQYTKFCAAYTIPIPYDEGWGRDNRPVINITWNRANEFCNWLSRKTGKNIRLPTEAQWEYAARGTDQRRYPWGNSEPDCSLANFANCRGKAQSVGFYRGTSYFGLHDMAGNVAEWCRDRYEDNYYSYSPVRNPSGPDNPTSMIRVVRGGSWGSFLDLSLRSADRLGFRSGYNQYIGFRIVMETE